MRIARWLCGLDLLFYHVRCALRAEFSRYYLHFVWWFLDPLFNLATLYVVFGIFLASPIPNYLLFLLTGIVAWQWFGSTIPHATNSIYGSMRMFRQFRVNPVHFPLCVCLQDFIKYVPVFLTFLLAAAALSANGPSLVWFNIVPILLVEAVCVVGVAIFVAALVPFLPDLGFVVSIVTQVLFFASGIFFSIEDVVLPKHRIILYSNPVAVCIKSLRGILLDGQAPDWKLLGYALSISLVFLGSGLALALRSRRLYPRIIEQ